MSPPARRRVIVVIIAASAWWISLGLMAALTSNPTVLNVTQVLEARLVIEARKLDAGDQLQVVRGFASDRLGRRGHRHAGAQRKLPGAALARR